MAETELSEHHLKWPLVHVAVSLGLSVPFPLSSHTVFSGPNGSWGEAAACRDFMERPVPPLSSVFRGLAGKFISDLSADPG